MNFIKSQWQNLTKGVWGNDHKDIGKGSFTTLNKKKTPKTCYKIVRVVFYVFYFSYCLICIGLGVAYFSDTLDVKALISEILVNACSGMLLIIALIIDNFT